MKNKIFTKIITFAVLLALVFSGCSKNSDTPNHRSKDVGNSTSRAPMETSAAMEATSDLNYDGVALQEVEMNEMGYEINGSPLNPEQPDIAPSSSTNQMLIRTMTITADTVDFPGITSLIDVAVINNGGYYDSLNITGTGEEKNYRHGYFVIRVPANNLDSLVSTLEGNYTITSRSESTEDVTLSYVDIETHLSTLRIELDDLLAMLENAQDMETIVYLQSEISNIRYQIESYESQRRVMADQVNYSTLYLTINEVVEVEEKTTIEEKREKTFGDELSETWGESVANLKENAQDTFLWLVSVSPYIGIFCIIFLIFVIVVISRKTIKRKKAKAVTATK